MAFGAPAFVDFEPDPSGNGYHFKKPTGESIYAYGDEADRLARNIAATKPPDMRTANAMMSTESDNANRSVPDTGEAPIGATPPAPAGPPAAPEPVRQGTTVDAQGIPAELPPMAGAAPAGAAEAAPRPQLNISPVQYHAPVNPKKMVENAVAVPVAESMTIQGGIQDPADRAAAIENLAKQEEAQRGMMGVQESVLKQQQSQAETDALNAALARQQAERQVAEGEAQKTLLRQEFQKRTNIAQHELDQQSSREVDQFRLFRGKPGAQVAGMLFAAIGGFASQFNKSGRNPFMDAIDRTMDNDIAAQRQEIQQGVAKANNDLARIKETYGLDYDDASSVLKLAYIKKTEAEANRRAALIGGQQSQVNLAALQPTFLKWQADAEAALQAKLMGTIQVTRQARMVQPSAGGFSAKTPEQRAKEARARSEEAKAEYEYGYYSTGQAPPKAGAGGKGNLPASLKRIQSVNEAGAEDIVGLQKLDPGGVLLEKVPEALRSQERINYEAAVNAAAPKILAANGEEQSKEALAAVKEHLLSPLPSVRRAAQARYLGAGQAVHRAIERQRGDIGPGESGEGER